VTKGNSALIEVKGQENALIEPAGGHHPVIKHTVKLQNGYI
jgi:hypothetical protein